MPSVICMPFRAPRFIIFNTIIRERWPSWGWVGMAVSDHLRVEQPGSMMLCSWNIVPKIFHGHWVFLNGEWLQKTQANLSPWSTWAMAQLWEGQLERDCLRDPSSLPRPCVSYRSKAVEASPLQAAGALRTSPAASFPALLPMKVSKSLGSGYET